MRTVKKLTPVSVADQEKIISSPKTRLVHRELMMTFPAMSELEIGGSASDKAMGLYVTVAAWNLERCLFVEQSAEKLSTLGADVVLLSEMDSGMARSSQRHTARDLGELLGMQYCYGVEFYEMGLGSTIEIERFCSDDQNDFGWHGNAILSKIPIEKALLVRLDDHGHWFCTDEFADPAQPRIGGRMAIAAIINGICFVTTHLESAAKSDYRCSQMKILLDKVEPFANGLPILIGGDLNTGNQMPPDYDWRRETLFRYCEERGYDWSFNPSGYTTRPSLITIAPENKMKLDWFTTKGLEVVQAGIEPSINNNGTPLSDHDCIWLRAKV